MQSERYRNFATELYPESCALDIVAAIDDLHVPGFLSPLHDRDFDKNQVPKKPHYHLLLMFPGKKSFDQVVELVRPLGAVGLEIVQSVSGYARYLCHIDNPEKAQYSPVLVRSFAGADYLDVISSEADKTKAFIALMDFTRKANIFYYSDLLEKLLEYGENELYRYSLFALCNPINKFLSSKLGKASYEKLKKEGKEK